MNLNNPPLKYFSDFSPLPKRHGESKQYDVIDSTGEGWLLLTEAMVLSPMNFLKRKWTKLEIIRLYNNRVNKSDPNEKPYSEKSLSAKKLERIIRDLVDRLE